MRDQTGRKGDAFQDQVVWITGASSGIGAALVHEFIDQGARVVLSARRESELNNVSRECVEGGCDAARLLVLPLDVTHYDAMPAAVQQVLDTFGGIDLLINNAGLSQRSLCLDTDMDVYRQLLEVDVLGQIALTKSVLPHMVTRGSGHLAVTASVAGKVGAPLRTGYCAAKHAVMGFFDALRTEVAHQNIRVTTIIPGFIRTDIARNALTGTGAPAGMADGDIDGGMDVQACARMIVDGFVAGQEEIDVGVGPEMDLLKLKRDNPTAAFRLMEAMAADALTSRAAE
ncbi:short chain dehydrogenase [Kineobactrum sediminis]|uniref:Short chain dehydrogenase n=1 Tax=Kineobactrum sediminis TaxID=1905677 RepID=A0A2N5Y5Q7_9GAMM|nr:SDR family oxidoreductase [Kineobactrum sediminis]PLW83727.1 short chain dehydrogenase [Kineobactrum sediminis]